MPGTVKTSDQVRDELEFLQSKLDCCLVIDGDSLQVCLFPFSEKWANLNDLLYIAMSQSFQESVHRDCYETVRCRCLPVLANTESRCCTSYSTIYKKESLLHR